MIEYTVKQGDTGDVIVVPTPESATAGVWSCALRVLMPDGTAPIARSVTHTDETGTKFLVYLTAEETGSLAVETYRMVVELTNTAVIPIVNKEIHYSLNIDPQIEIGSNPGLIHLTPGANSFATYEELLYKASTLPALAQLVKAPRGKLKAALLNAYENIGRLVTDFGLLDANNHLITSTSDMSADQLLTLDRREINALLVAQLTEANGVLGGSPVEDRRKAGLISDSTGESAHFFRTTKPLDLPVYRATAEALRGYLMWSRRVSR